MYQTTFEKLVHEGHLEIGDGYRAKNEELGGTGPIFLRAAYLQDAGFMLNNPDRFKSDKGAKFGSKMSALGDVVITTKGNSTGRVGRIREAEAGAIYSPHLSYWRSKNPDVLDQMFLFYWSRGREFREQLAGMAASTDMAPYLSLRGQLRLRITLPKIGMQRSAGNILGALDDKIDLNRRMNETLEAMARAIFKDWFVDFGPVRAKSEGFQPPCLPHSVAELFPDRLDGDGLPKGWRSVPVRDIVIFNPAERLPSGLPAPYLDMAALPTTGSWPDKAVQRPFTSGSRFRAGDTLLARITPCLENGKAAYLHDLEDIGWGSTEFIVMRSRKPVPRPYPYLLARDPAFRDHAIRSMTGTSGRQRVQVDALSDFRVVAPTDVVLIAFGEIIEPWFTFIAMNAQQSEALGELRDLLIPKLILGEIRVNEAEKLVEAA